jgi:hypothetical protein
VPGDLGGVGRGGPGTRTPGASAHPVTQRVHKLWGARKTTGTRLAWDRSALTRRLPFEDHSPAITTFPTCCRASKYSYAGLVSRNPNTRPMIGRVLWVAIAAFMAGIGTSDRQFRRVAGTCDDRASPATGRTGGFGNSGIAGRGDKLSGSGGGAAGSVGHQESDRFAMPLRIATPHGTLSFLSTTTVFGTPSDVTLSKLALELLFPADDETIEMARRMTDHDSHGVRTVELVAHLS